MRRLVTGISIVSGTTRAGAPVGLTVNSFNSLSLEPPLILWSLRTRSRMLESFEHSTHFAVNILAGDQADLCHKFAVPGVREFSETHWSRNQHGVPTLNDGAAVFECGAVERLTFGDHVLFVGHVLRCSHSDRTPLVSHGGRIIGLD